MLLKVDTCYRLPRMRGDRPSRCHCCVGSHRFTPHARGSTLIGALRPDAYQVYPACAGIDLYLSRKNLYTYGLPRMRGDRPYHSELRESKKPFTPHARGSTHRVYHWCCVASVYPACAGIDRIYLTSLLLLLCLPRMRGDRPQSRTSLPVMIPFTPHARGST